MLNLEIASLAAGLVAMSTLAVAGPCDHYASSGTPCIAAHGTTRALFNAYNEALYQVIRGSDNSTRDIFPRSAGGVANGNAQDNFCAGTTCLISIIYDQTGRGNHLTRAPGGSQGDGPEPGGYDYLASAIGAPVKLNGQLAYGVFIPPKTGYRQNKVNGSAVGDQPEGMYAVLDGTHFNDGCCFDYGNAEVDNNDKGNGEMEAIYFGDRHVRGSGAGDGPWVLADLENGIFADSTGGKNTNVPSSKSRFVTAVVKGEPNHWAIRGGNAASGPLSTYYDGIRPTAGGYYPMTKEGAIVLGVGGDNSRAGQGTFYEGIMTYGYPSDATENAVQADVVAAKYAPAPLNSGPAINVGSSVSLKATSFCCTNKYLAHNGSDTGLQVVSSSSADALKKQASWTVRQGLGNRECYSFESKDTPGTFLRHSQFQLYANANDGGKQFREDATFCLQAGLNGKGNSIRSWNYPTHYFRHYRGVGYLARNGGQRDADTTNLFNDDVSWIIRPGFA